MPEYEVDELLEGDDLYGEDDDEDFEGDDEDFDGDDLFEGDDDDDEYGARRRRRARRRARRRSGRRVPTRKARLRRAPGGNGTLPLKFAITACGIGATVQLTAQANRDCRPLDLRVVGTTAVGVVDPGIQIGDLSVHGKDLHLSGGLVGGQLYDPLSPVYPNCAIPEVIKAGETVTLTVTGVSAAATVVSAVLQCRAKA